MEGEAPSDPTGSHRCRRGPVLLGARRPVTSFQGRNHRGYQEHRCKSKEGRQDEKHKGAGGRGVLQELLPRTVTKLTRTYRCVRVYASLVPNRHNVLQSSLVGQSLVHLPRQCRTSAQHVGDVALEKRCQLVAAAAAAIVSVFARLCMLTPYSTGQSMPLLCRSSANDIAIPSTLERLDQHILRYSGWC